MVFGIMGGVTRGTAFVLYDFVLKRTLFYNQADIFYLAAVPFDGPAVACEAQQLILFQKHVWMGGGMG